MRRLSVLIAGVEDALLCQIIADSLKERTEATVRILPSDVPRAAIERAALRERPDVVIIGLSQVELSPTCKQLLDQLPESVVVGVHVNNAEVDSGRVRIVQHALYSEDMGPRELVNVVLAATREE